MATELTVEEVQAKLLKVRQEQGISETVKPTRSIVKSQSNDVVAEIMNRVETISPYHDSNYLPCGERAEYKHCKAFERLNGIYEQREHPEKVLIHWNVPRKHLKSSFDNFEGGEAAKKMCKESVKKYGSVLLSGPTGCGKTHLAVAMLRQRIFNSTTKVFRHDHYNDRQDSVFVTVPELLMEIRSTFNNPNESEEKVVEKYSDVPLLVLDDLGAEKITDWSESTLYLIIDRRNRDEDWTIVTTNLSLPEIEKHMGARIASRLSDMKVINLKLPDYRKKRQA